MKAKLLIRHKIGYKPNKKQKSKSVEVKKWSKIGLRHPNRIRRTGSQVYNK